MVGYSTGCLHSLRIVEAAVECLRLGEVIFMRQPENDMTARARPASNVALGPFLEIVAINIAWPLCLIRFGTGIVTGHPFEALQGLVLFFVVVLYTLVRLGQASRAD